MSKPTFGAWIARGPFSEWAIAKRLELGLTQQDVARRLGVTSTWVCDLERKKKPTAYKIALLCGVLGLDAHEGLRLAGHEPMTAKKLAALVDAHMLVAAPYRRTIHVSRVV